MQVVQSWAVKYRPRLFNDLVGQDAVVARLRGMLKTKTLPNALLFTGPAGSGKTTCARMFARYVNCETGKACGKCPSCLHNPESHPDITEENAANQRGIEEIRKLIQTSTFMPRYNVRIFILDEASNFTPQAIQAFLKPLEEPPPATMWIMCTTDPQKFPDSVTSRCQRFEMSIPAKDDVSKRLLRIAEKEKITFPKGVIERVADYSGGRMRLAVTLLESAAQYLASDPEADAKAIVQNVSRSMEPEYSQVATKIMLGLYLKRPKVVASAIYDLTSPAIELVNAMLRMNDYLIGINVNGESRNIWHTPDLKKFKAIVDNKVPDTNFELLVEVESILVGLRSDLQQFAVPDRALLIARLVKFGT